MTFVNLVVSGLWLWLVYYALDEDNKFCGMLALGIVVLFCMRHTDLRYAIQYSVNPNQVHQSDRPVDCDFWTAPVGNKGCHYERVIVRSDDVREGAWFATDDVYVQWIRVEGDD